MRHWFKMVSMYSEKKAYTLVLHSLHLIPQENSKVASHHFDADDHWRLHLAEVDDGYLGLWSLLGRKPHK